jgi:hypothetical protein
MSGEIFSGSIATLVFIRIPLVRPVLAQVGIRGVTGVMKSRTSHPKEDAL